MASLDINEKGADLTLEARLGLFANPEDRFFRVEAFMALSKCVN